MPQTPELDSLKNGILSGDRASLSQGITLVESNLDAHAEASEQLLDAILFKTGNALRVAVTGAPGVGKSTLIETLGMHLVQKGSRVAVLSIDPSSPETGGSIMGDKTRMAHLAQHPLAFIRPSPSGNFQGGISHATRSAILLCEAAGYNPILIETVGTGQGDYAVRQLVDVVLLLVLAHAGDELQGIKRGILETADLIAVTKADGNLKHEATLAAKAYRRALSLYSNRFRTPKVVTCSALDDVGVTDIWVEILDFELAARQQGYFQQQRQHQIAAAVTETAKNLLLTRFRKSEPVHEMLEDLEQKVLNGECTVHHAANQLVHAYLEIHHSE